MQLENGLLQKQETSSRDVIRQMKSERRNSELFANLKGLSVLDAKKASESSTYIKLDLGGTKKLDETSENSFKSEIDENTELDSTPLASPGGPMLRRQNVRMKADLKTK